MLGTMFRGCVAAVRSGLWTIPTPIDQVLDGHRVQTYVTINALCEQWWPTEQHPGTCCTCCVTKDHWEPSACSKTQITCAAGQSTIYTTTWCSIVSSEESMFCLYASDGRTHVRHRPSERHLLECIRPQHIGPTSGFMVWGPSVTTCGHMWCFCRVK